MIFRRKTKIAVRVEEVFTCRMQAASPESWCQYCGRRALFILREEAAYWENQARLHAGKAEQFEDKEDKKEDKKGG